MLKHIEQLREESSPPPMGSFPQPPAQLEPERGLASVTAKDPDLAPSPVGSVAADVAQPPPPPPPPSSSIVGVAASPDAGADSALAEQLVELRRLRGRVVELDAELAEEHRMLCEETRRADEAEFRMTEALDQAARSHAESDARVRTAEKAAALRCTEAAQIEARAAHKQAQAEAVVEAASAREMLGKEEWEELGQLTKRLDASERRRFEAETVAKDLEQKYLQSERQRKEAETRLKEVQTELHKARKTAAAVRMATTAVTKSDSTEARSAGDKLSGSVEEAQNERLAQLAFSQRSLLVQVRQLLGKYATDLREPAPGLAKCVTPRT